MPRPHQTPLSALPSILEPTNRVPTGSQGTLPARYRMLVEALLDSPRPGRAKLVQLGQDVAQVAGRQRAWSGVHLYILLHPERFPDHLPSKKLVLALEQLAVRRGVWGPDSLRDARVLEGPGVHVERGAIVLASSVRCPCGVYFVPRAPHQKYHDLLCKREHDKLRKRERRKRHE